MQLVDDALVAGLQGRVAHVAEVPVEGPVQVGEAGGELGADVVERGSAVHVCGNEAVGVGCAVFGGVAVEDVAAKGGRGHAVEELGRAGAGLGVLAGHAGNADDGLRGGMDKDEAHLQQQLHLGIDGVGGAVVEQLCAVAALQQELTAEGDVAQLVLEGDNLSRGNDGGQSLQLGQGGLERGAVRIDDVLFDRFARPGCVRKG